MTTLTYTNNDPTALAVLEAARQAYNAANPQNLMPDAQAFWQWRCDSIVSGIVQAAKQAQIDAALAAFSSGDGSKLIALAQSVAPKG